MRSELGSVFIRGNPCWNLDAEEKAMDDIFEAGV
jgi:hypothetical protein